MSAYWLLARFANNFNDIGSITTDLFYESFDCFPYNFNILDECCKGVVTGLFNTTKFSFVYGEIMVDFFGVNFVNNWESFELIDYLYEA